MSQEFRATLAKYGPATLNSQKAILRARNKLLTQLESNQDFPLLFLTEELFKWESLQTKPRQLALKYVSVGFFFIGLAETVIAMVFLLIPLLKSLTYSITKVQSTHPRCNQWHLFIPLRISRTARSISVVSNKDFFSSDDKPFSVSQ